MVSSLWGDQLRFRLKTNGTTSTLLSNSGEIVAGNWYHVAAVYDGSEMRLYKNGAEVVPGIPKSGSITNGSAPVTIGNQPTDNKPFDGTLDDVCLFNQALTATEILDIKNNGSGSTRQPKQPVQALVPVKNPTVLPTAVTKIQRSYYSIAGQMVGVRVKKINSNGSTNSDELYYTYIDHLGSVGALSDKNGTYISGSLTLFRPFGDYRREPSTNPSITDRAFTGHRHNDEVGLIYMGARYFLPEIGRFISADTLVPDPMNPQQFNRYTYGLNNPIKNIDPTGHQSQESNPNPLQACDPMFQSCTPDIPWYIMEINQNCNQGDCMAGHLFVYFGIPTTDKQRDYIIQKEAQRLCLEYGSCQERAIGMLLGVATGFMPPIALISVPYNVGVAMSQQDTGDIVQEANAEVASEVLEQAAQHGDVPIGRVGGAFVEGLSLAVDLYSYEKEMDKWRDIAEGNVDKRTDQLLMNLEYNWQFGGAVPWLPPVPSVTASNYAWMPKVNFGISR